MNVAEYLSQKTKEGRSIETIYTGLEMGCRCGCAGRYFKPGEKGFTRAYNKALKLNPNVVCAVDENGSFSLKSVNDYLDRSENVAHFDPSGSWLDIAITETYPFKTITIYFDE